MTKMCSKCDSRPRMRNGYVWCHICKNESERRRYAEAPMVDKPCRKCGTTIRCNKLKAGLCKSCQSAYNKFRYANNVNGHRDKCLSYNVPEVRRAQKLRREYNLTEAQVGAMLYLQECRCALCRVELRAPEAKKGQRQDVYAIDHDHVTGDVRGILCIKCNVALGGFRDDATLLERAAAYIKASA